MMDRFLASFFVLINEYPGKGIWIIEKMFEKLLEPGLKRLVAVLGNHEHNKLMEKINELPFGDEHSKIYKVSLEELFAKYQEQMKALKETSTAYEDIAVLIRQRQPLTNTTKYARVRRNETL